MVEKNHPPVKLNDVIGVIVKIKLGKTRIFQKLELWMVVFCIKKYYHKIKPIVNIFSNKVVRKITFFLFHFFIEFEVDDFRSGVATDNAVLGDFQP